MRWIAIFSAACVAMIASGLFVVWAANDFTDLGLHGNGLVAMLLGLVLTSGLGVGLMALVFHSSRTEHDRLVYHLDGDPND